jgi:hypothetical protein
MHAYTQTEYRAKESLPRALSQPRRLSQNPFHFWGSHHSGLQPPPLDTELQPTRPWEIHEESHVTHSPSVVRTISAGNDTTICFRKDQPGTATLTSTPICMLASRKPRSVIISAPPASGFADRNKRLFDPLQIQEKSPLAVTECGPYKSTNRLMEGEKRRSRTPAQAKGLQLKPDE